MLTLAVTLILTPALDDELKGTMPRAPFSVKSDLQDPGEAGGYAVSTNASWGMLDVAIKASSIALVVKKNDCCGPKGTECDRIVALANGTPNVQWFQAEDSVLGVVRQALNARNEWKPVEYWGGSDCGNSFHRVALTPSRCWVWDVPKAKGSIATKCRYAFYGLEPPLFSEVFDSHVEASDFFLEPSLTGNYSIGVNGRLTFRQKT